MRVVEVQDSRALGGRKDVVGASMRKSRPEVGEELLGRFRIEALIGVGGFSSVYRVSDKRSKCLYAAKCFPVRPPQEGIDKIANACLEDLAGLYGIAGVPQLVDHGDVDGFTVIIMTFIEDGSLESTFRGSPKNWRDVSSLCIRMCEIVANCHDRGVYHGDLKPSNIMINKGGDPWIVDFGSARATRGGYVVGTLAYSPPEFFRHDDNLPSARLGDIFSLGLTIVELLLGETVYRQGNTIADLLRLKMQDASPWVAKVKAPERVKEILVAMLDRDPKARPTSLREVIDVFRSPGSHSSVAMHIVPEFQLGEIEDAKWLLYGAPGAMRLVERTPNGLEARRIYKIPADRHIALQDLLVELFTDFRELRDHLPRIVRKSLPGCAAPLDEGAFTTVELMVRQGSVDQEFFDHLIERFPRREFEIRIVEDLWRSYLSTRPDTE